MDQNCKKAGKVWIVAAALVVAAFAIGISVYQGLKKVSMGERVVTVKGKAEMDVKADVASMSISFSVKKNTLNELLADAKAKKVIVVDYLKELGFKDNEIFVGNISIDEHDYKDATYKFFGSQNINVISRDIDKVTKLQEGLGALYDKGIIFNQGYWNNGASYDITNIDSFKPQLITESMKSAKKAGEQFAKDADSKLGKMKTAWQGQITIEDVDETTPQIKRCRVVSTITYYLED